VFKPVGSLYVTHPAVHHKGIFYQHSNSKCPDNGREVVSQVFNDTAPTTEVTVRRTACGNEQCELNVRTYSYILGRKKEKERERGLLLL
jgi:hypothetical protein